MKRLSSARPDLLFERKLKFFSQDFNTCVTQSPVKDWFLGYTKRQAIIAAVSGVLLVYLWSSFTLSTTQKRELEKLEAETSRAAQELAYGFRAVELVLQTAAQNTAATGQLKGLQPYLKRISNRLPPLKTITAITPDGIIQSDLREGEPAVGINVFERAYLQAHLTPQDVGFYYSPPIRSRVDNRVQMTLSIAARQPDGNLEGVIVSSIDDNFFKVFVTSLSQSTQYEARVIHETGGDVYTFTTSRPEPTVSILTRIYGWLMGLNNVVHKYDLPISHTNLIFHLELPATHYLEVTAQSTLSATILVLSLLLVSGVILRFKNKYALDREQLLQQHRLTNERLRLAKRPALIGVWELNPTTGKVEWDDDMANLYSVSEGQKPHNLEEWRERLPPKEGSKLVEAINTALQHSEDFTFSFSILHPDGERRHINAMGTVIPGEGSTVARIIGINQDVTDHVSQQNKLREARDMAEEANKAKSVFLAEMSHELRTPLNAIIGYAQFIHLSEADLPPTQIRRYAQDINNAGRILLNHIEDILDYSEVDVGNREFHLEPVDIRSTTAQVIRLLAPSLRQNKIRPRVDLPKHLAVMADKRAFRQILTNIIGNAVKYSPSGTDIWVRARPHIKDKVSIKITDAGPGIPEEDLQNVLQPFTRGKETYLASEPGTGLGLAITRKLVVAMSGAMELRNADKGGLEVTIELSLSDEGIDASEKFI